jgi:hypothetical protein
MLNSLREFRVPDLEAIMGELETLVGLDYATDVSGSRHVGESVVHFSLKRFVAHQL